MPDLSRSAASLATPRTQEEIDAEIEVLRDELEGEMQAVERPAGRMSKGQGTSPGGNPAAAVEHRCALFLTNDAPLKTFPDILVEILS